MWRRNRATAVLLVLGSVATIAQEPVSPVGGGVEPLKLDLVVAQGERGKPVPGLAQSSFTLLDNGAPQAITSFRAVAGMGAPVKVLIVLDAVNLDFTRLAYEQGELERFLRGNEGQLSQPTSLAILTDTATQVEPGYTTDGNGLSAALGKQTVGLRELRRSAGFYGAEQRLDLSLKALDGLLARVAAEPGRKFIVWMTPGWPLLSGPGVELNNNQERRIFGQVVGFSNALRRADTTMYVIDPLGSSEDPGRTFYYQAFLKGVEKSSQAQLGDLGVQVLAQQSGGLVLSGNNDLAGLLRECYADASTYYEVSYVPPPSETPGEYHRVQVRVAEPHLVARTRQGYYAAP